VYDGKAEVLHLHPSHTPPVLAVAATDEISSPIPGQKLLHLFLLHPMYEKKCLSMIQSLYHIGCTIYYVGFAVALDRDPLSKDPSVLECLSRAGDHFDLIFCNKCE
jgi:hypothetical protein